MALAKTKKLLQDLGFTGTEARVYIAMLELGPQSVQNIAKKAGVSRTAAYDIIGSLQKKGLVSTFRKGKRKMFTAEDPERLKGYFKQHLERKKNLVRELKQLLPELRLMQAEDRPKIRYYTGEEGLRALFRDIEDIRAKTMLEVTPGKLVYEAIDAELLLELRSSKFFQKIKSKVLYRGSPPINPKQGAEFRRLDDAFGDFTGNIWVYKNRVTLTSFIGDPESIIIESDVFADTMRVLFNAAWSAAEPIHVHTS